MNKKLQISDDSGFIGLANLSQYNSFISADWDFDQLKSRIIEQTNKNNILFWSTGREDLWEVEIITNNEFAQKNFFRNEEALIQVTENKLHLVNYETLSMAAQFQHIKLPEDHLKELDIELENGFYIVEFCQIKNPTKMAKKKEVDFQIRLEKIENKTEYYPNNFGNIFWHLQ